jgi:hypothetical protein
MTDAYRACPLCGTRSTYYMLVCRHCGRSLRGVPLVGTPPPGTVGGGGPGTFARVALGAVALAAAAAAVVFTVKRLRPSTFEGAVAASEPTPAPEPPPPERTGWETLEQRLADLPPAPARSTSPAPDATRPLAVAATAPPGLSTAPPLSPGPAATATPNAGAGPAVAAPTPRPPRAAPAASPEAGAAAAERGAGGDVRSARRTALRRAEERVQSLERRASSLRDHLGDEEITAGERQRLEDELATVLLQLEDAEREVIRAEWALRSVEE